MTAEQTGWVITGASDAAFVDFPRIFSHIGLPRVERGDLYRADRPAENVLGLLQTIMIIDGWSQIMFDPSLGFMVMECVDEGIRVAIATFQAGELQPLALPDSGYLIIVFRGSATA